MSTEGPGLVKEPWFVYLLLCRNGAIYTGVARDPDKRLLAHLQGRGARYTRSFPPVALLYREEWEDKSQALRRERWIKRLPRREKWRFMFGANLRG